jgi:hypothetical protein
MYMNFPIQYTTDKVPAEVRELVDSLVPSLLEGSHPALSALREQFSRSAIGSAELSGVGVFVEFKIPPDERLAVPSDFTGGSADISLQGVEHGAGCVLFIRAGKLAMFEAFTYDEPWPENSRVVRVENVMPIDPGAERSGR